MKKKVWIMNHYACSMLFKQGGRHYNFAKYLKQYGYNPVVFCANSKHGVGELWFETEELNHEHMAEEIGVPFVFVKARAYANNGKQRALNMIDFYRNVKRTAKAYAKKHGNPDVIYASSVHPLTLVAGIQLAKYFGVKCICEVRDLWPESIVEYSTKWKRTNPLVKLLYQGEKWIYQKADKLIFTAEGCYDYIVEQGWEKAIPREKFHYINNGVDLEAFLDNREKYQTNDPDLDNPDIFKVVYAGSVRRVNNLGLLLDAAKLIKDPRVRILIWGTGNELTALQQRLIDENIANVVFKGWVEKKYIPYIVSKADLNIAHNTPSPLFRFGISFNKLFDYLAAGKPVLSDFPCRYNPAVKCHAGSSVDEPTANNIAEEIVRFVNMSPAEYREYCDNAESAAPKFCFAELTKQLINVIEGTV